MANRTGRRMNADRTIGLLVVSALAPAIAIEPLNPDVMDSSGKPAAWTHCLYQVKDSLKIQPYDSCMSGKNTAMSKISLGETQYDSAGRAWISTNEFKGVLLQKGRGVVIWGIPYFDNGIDEFKNGLIRFERGGKTGYAAADGKIVIKPKYDGAWQFKNGFAMVCVGCVKEPCREKDCEHLALIGGKWAMINKSGKTVKKIKDWKEGYDWWRKKWGRKK